MSHLVLSVSNWVNFGLIIDFFQELNNRRKNAALVRETYDALSRLSDRELRDIGVHRGEIRSIAESMGSYYTDCISARNTNQNLGGWV